MIPESVRLERERRKSAREARNWEREKFLMEKLFSPTVVRLALVSGILAYSTYITRSPRRESPVASTLALALPTVGIPMIAAEAGITDKYALAAIAAASGGYAAGQGVIGLTEAGYSPFSTSGDEMPWFLGMVNPVAPVAWRILQMSGLGK